MSLQILAFCGSLRRISMNAALLRAAARLAPAGMTLEICALGELPLFNPDLEADLPAPVRRLRKWPFEQRRAIVWRSTCSGGAPRLMRSEKCSGTNAPRAPRSMPRWISNRCER